MSGRRLLTLIRREVLATFRDPFTVGMLIAVPLAAMLVFGFIVSTEVRHLDLGVLDADGSSASRRLLADLEANGSFRLVPLASRDAIDDALVSGRISAAVVVPRDFDRRLREWRPGEKPPEVQAIVDGAEPVLAGNADAFLRTTLNASITGLLPAGAGARTPARVAVVARALFNPRLDGKPFMVAGVFGFVLSFLTTLITAVSIVNERITGTFEQLQVTPATSLEILLGKILPLGAVFALDVVLMVVAAGLVLGVWPAGSTLFFVLVSSFYVLVSLALGLIISVTSHTAAEAVQKTVLLSIPLVQLSGFIFPVRSMPAVVQWLTEIFPATHYIRLSRAIYLRAEGPIGTWPDLLALFFFGVALMALSLRTMEARE